jgi:hypothetical protein
MKKTSILTFALAIFSTSAAAQQSLTAADYDRAVKMLNFSTSALVDRGGVNPTFLPDGRFWYKVLTPTGSEYVIFDPQNGRAEGGPEACGPRYPRQRARRR